MERNTYDQTRIQLCFSVPLNKLYLTWVAYTLNLNEWRHSKISKSNPIQGVFES